MKKTAIIIMLVLSTSCFATNDQMNEDLVKVVQELQSIKPLLEKAEKEQEKNTRIKINFEDFKGPNGKTHNGLKSDIETIQKSIIEIINSETIEPRVVDPISGDFVSKEKI